MDVEVRAHVRGRARALARMCEDARARAHERCMRNTQAPEQSESYIRRCETGHVAFRIVRKFEIGHFAFRTFRRCETGHFAVSQGAKPDTPQFRTRTLRRQTLSESVWRRNTNEGIVQVSDTPTQKHSGAGSPGRVIEAECTVPLAKVAHVDYHSLH